MGQGMSDEGGYRQQRAEEGEPSAHERGLTPEEPGGDAEERPQRQRFHTATPPRAATLAAMDLPQAVDQSIELGLSHVTYPVRMGRSHLAASITPATCARNYVAGSCGILWDGSAPLLLTPSGGILAPRGGRAANNVNEVVRSLLGGTTTRLE